MTNKDRAEKIWDVVFKGYSGQWSDKQITEYITAQLDEACAEEYAQGAINQQKICAEHGLKMWNAAREKAKGIAKTCIRFKEGCCGFEIADRIAKMRPEDASDVRREP